MKKFNYPLTRLQDYYRTNLTTLLIQLAQKKVQLESQQRTFEKLEQEYSDCEKYSSIFAGNSVSTMATLQFRRELYKKCQQEHERLKVAQKEVDQVHDDVKQEKLRIEQIDRHRSRQFVIFSEQHRRHEYNLQDEQYLSRQK